MARYRKNGVAKTTRQLVDAVSTGGVEALTLLDIGGGLGGVQHELIDRGVIQSTHVDASSAYLQAAQEEASNRDLLDRITFVAGDFVEVGENIPQADIVTLDRVVCCYDDMQALIRLSAKKARRTYGLVFPRDIWLFKVFLPIVNFVLKLRGSSFRIFLHSTQQIEGIIKSMGLSLETKQKAGFWQILVFNRI
jgi:2-polyprenyl-3-methyl-5-hydroxy-6-metoxy-1,4-benzoquinol methylase